MATEDQQPTQKKERGPRLVTRNDYIGCGIAALLVGMNNARQRGVTDLAALIPYLFGTFAAILILWVCIRGIYRWVTKDRRSQPPVA
jgi:hypothetical protein